MGIASDVMDSGAKRLACLHKVSPTVEKLGRGQEKGNFGNFDVVQNTWHMGRSESGREYEMLMVNCAGPHVHVQSLHPVKRSRRL